TDGRGAARPRRPAGGHGAAQTHRPPAGIHRGAARRRFPYAAPGVPAAPPLADGTGPAAGRRARRRPVRRAAARAVRPGRPARHPSRRRARDRREPVTTALRLGTRGSALALAQSHIVADALTAATG